MLFKLVKDPQPPGHSFYIYGGETPQYELAAKASLHDLRGAQKYVKCMLSLLQPSVYFDAIFCVFDSFLDISKPLTQSKIRAV
jgi:hypothetical protein